MQRRKVKCKACGKELYNVDAFKVSKNNKNIYYCSEDEYIEIYNRKQIKSNCFRYIAELINAPILPPVFIKSVNEVAKFYDYEVIQRTFKRQKEKVLWALGNREFNTEFAKCKYIMSIILNNINAVNNEVKREKEKVNIDRYVETEIFDIPQQVEASNNKKDLSRFLD